MKQAQEVIEADYGKKYVLSEARRYKNKKGAQEAHEAVRPVNLSIRPDDLKDKIGRDHFRLYKLIWERTIASQMPTCISDRTAIDVSAGKYLLRANGQVMRFDGFMKVYIEGLDEGDEQDSEKILPDVAEGDGLDVEKIEPTQHFTKPPARYTEASLVKKLESLGIGRPSTYAPTIGTIVQRGYIVKNPEKQLVPEDIGNVVVDLLVEHFPNIVDYQFTAEMEDDLDKIAEGEKEWVPILKAFYGPFHALIEAKNKSIKKEDIAQETDEICEKCGAKMVIKFGRFGKFLSCSKYPTCKNAKPLGKNAAEQKEIETAEKKFHDKKCTKCGAQMEVKVGRYGPFLACSAYPKCKNIQKIVNMIGVKCPECGGQVVEKRTKRGKTFYGCNKYPKCKFASWDKLSKEPCPKCGWVMAEKKSGNVCLKCGM